MRNGCLEAPRRGLACATGALLLLAGVRSIAALDSNDAPGPGVRQALDRALDDERRAIAFYKAVIARFGDRQPFANILDAERRHADELLRQYARLGLQPPGDRWESLPFQVPDTFAEACDAAEISEFRNAALYDELIGQVADATVRAVFERLRAASQERHLHAFRQHSNGWRVVTPDDLSAAQKAQQTLAASARDEAFAQLMARLGAELQAGGPQRAIEACQQAAPAIAKDVGERRDVRLGRTSWKLRNPKNTAPPWAELLLHDKPEAPRVAVAGDGRLGATFPIRVSTTCLVCHGPVESIDPAVREQLRTAYPADEAVGFRDRDLRGWFWVEVPSRAPRSERDPEAQ